VSKFKPELRTQTGKFEFHFGKKKRPRDQSDTKSEKETPTTFFVRGRREVGGIE